MSSFSFALLLAASAKVGQDLSTPVQKGRGLLPPTMTPIRMHIHGIIGAALMCKRSSLMEAIGRASASRD